MISGQLGRFQTAWKSALKDKSGIGIIIDYSRDYTVVNGV